MRINTVVHVSKKGGISGIVSQVLLSLYTVCLSSGMLILLAIFDTLVYPDRIRTDHLKVKYGLRQHRKYKEQMLQASSRWAIHL